MYEILYACVNVTICVDHKNHNIHIASSTFLGSLCRPLMLLDV